MKATQDLALLLAAGALLAPASAQAHISLHPNTIPAGAFATLDVRVPGEQEGAYVKKVDVLFPAGFTGVDYENVPGWSAQVIETKLATPIKEDGETIDTEVSQIVWTWTGPLGQGRTTASSSTSRCRLRSRDNAAGKALEFRTVQTYSNGQVVHWIDPSLSAEHPSPRINVTAKGGVIEDSGRRRGRTRRGTDGRRPVDIGAEHAHRAKSGSAASKGLAHHRAASSARWGCWSGSPRSPWQDGPHAEPRPPSNP